MINDQEDDFMMMKEEGDGDYQEKEQEEGEDQEDQEDQEEEETWA